MPKEDCHICGVTFDSTESDFADLCEECAADLSGEKEEG